MLEFKNQKRPTSRLASLSRPWRWPNYDMASPFDCQTVSGKLRVTLYVMVSPLDPQNAVACPQNAVAKAARWLTALQTRATQLQ